MQGLLRRVCRSSDGGGALVELAMSLPILIFLIVGAADYARIFYTGMALANAARAGAQYGAYTNANVTDSTGIINAANNAATDIGTISVLPTCSFECSNGSITVCPAAPPACANPNTLRIYVVVGAAKTFHTLFRFRGLPSTVTLGRTVSMRAQ